MGIAQKVLYLFSVGCDKVLGNRANQLHNLMMRIIDLFSGAGGMSLGFVDPRFGGGFKTVLALDNDPAAVATHKANLDRKSVV